MELPSLANKKSTPADLNAWKAYSLGRWRYPTECRGRTRSMNRMTQVESSLKR